MITILRIEEQKLTTEILSRTDEFKNTVLGTVLSTSALTFRAKAAKYRPCRAITRFGRSTADIKLSSKMMSPTRPIVPQISRSIGCEHGG